MMRVHVGAWGAEATPPAAAVMARAAAGRMQPARPARSLSGSRAVVVGSGPAHLTPPALLRHAASVKMQAVGTRSNVQCLEKWYTQLSPSMVARGEWGSGDDRRLLRALFLRWDPKARQRRGFDQRGMALRVALGRSGGHPYLCVVLGGSEWLTPVAWRS